MKHNDWSSTQFYFSILLLGASTALAFAGHLSGWEWLVANGAASGGYTIRRTLRDVKEKKLQPAPTT